MSFKGGVYAGSSVSEFKPIAEEKSERLVSEMRIHYGAGYRASFVRNGNTVFVLLCGGSKASQKCCIKVAKHMAQELKASTS